MMIGKRVTRLMIISRMLTRNLYSLRCIQVIAGVLGRAGQEGQQRRKEAAERGEINYPPPVRLKEPYTPSLNDAKEV